MRFERRYWIPSVLILLMAVMTPTPATASSVELDQLLRSSFLENLGQWDSSIVFMGRTASMDVALQPDGIATPGATLHFEGARRVSPRGLSQLPGVCNFYLGRDATRWRTGVCRFAGAIYEGLYPGIDLHLRFNEGQLEYDLVLAPGADPSQFVGRIDGASKLHVDADGALVASTKEGKLRQRAPVSWVVAAHGTRQLVTCQYRLIDDTRFGFEVAASGEHPLVIDPVVEWSTYYGGSGDDNANGIHIDAASGDVLVSGWTNSFDLPQITGVPQSRDLVVVRIDPTNDTVEWMMLVGGSAVETAGNLDLGPNGEVCVAGSTFSSDFPVTAGAAQSSFGGIRDAVVVVLDSDGILQYSTHLGGSDLDVATSVQVVGSELTLGGWTQSVDLPTINAYQSNLKGVRDGFLSRLDLSSGLVTWQTYFGGSDAEFLYEPSTGNHENGATVAVNPATGVTTFCGRTYSSDLPTLNAYDDTLNGTCDSFVARLDPSLSPGDQLLWGTYFGGAYADAAIGIDLTENGQVAISGYTFSDEISFPITPGAIDGSYCGSFLLDGTAFDQNDGFLAVLDPTAAPSGQLLYSTYVGGCGGADALFAVRKWDGLIVACGAGSSGYPTTAGALQTSALAVFDCALVIVDPAAAPGSGPVYATLYGGGASSIWLNFDRHQADLVATGICFDPGYPTTAGAIQTTHAGGVFDVVVTKIRFETFTRADCNGDAFIDIADAIASLDLLFGSSGPSSCDDACDANDDGHLDIADPIFTLSYLFTTGSTAPAAPFPACGLDRTSDALGCGTFCL